MSTAARLKSELLPAEPARARDAARGGYAIEYGDRTVVRAERPAESAAERPAVVTLEAGRTLRVSAGEAIGLHAGGALRVGTTDGPALTLDAGTAALRTPALRVWATAAHAAVDRVRVQAERVESRAERVRVVADVVRTEAGRVTDRAKRLYREVERSLHTRAGTLEAYATERLLLLAQRVTLRGRRSVKIKSERIELG